MVTKREEKQYYPDLISYLICRLAAIPNNETGQRDHLTRNIVGPDLFILNLTGRINYWKGNNKQSFRIAQERRNPILSKLGTIRDIWQNHPLKEDNYSHLIIPILRKKLINRYRDAPADNRVEIRRFFRIDLDLPRIIPNHGLSTEEYNHLINSIHVVNNNITNFAGAREVQTTKKAGSAGVTEGDCISIDMITRVISDAPASLQKISIEMENFRTS